MLGPESIAVHCVHATDEELDILKETDTTMVHNPHSNMGNAVGVAPVVEMLRKGHACRARHRRLHRRHARLGVRSPRSCRATGSATRRSGSGRPCRCCLRQQPRRSARKHFARPLGVLTPGGYADLITLNYDPITPLTAGSTGGHILFGMSGSMVNDTMVNGAWVMRDRVITTVDEAEIFARSAERPRQRIWAQM